MPYTKTPRAYVKAISLYEPGSTEHRVASARATLALNAVRAYSNGDYALTSHSLEGLHRLAGLGEVDADALTRNISSAIEANTSGLSPEARALAAGEISNTALTVAGLVGGLVSILSAITPDPGVRAAADWMMLILAGRRPRSFTQSQLQEMANMCSVWTNQVRPWVANGPSVIRNGAEGGEAFFDNILGTPPGVDPAFEAILRGVEQFAGWVLFAFDTICSTLTPVLPPRPPCSPPGQPPRRIGRNPATGQPLPLSAAGCCPGLVYSRASGNCEASVPASDADLARRRFQRAWVARRDVEALLYALRNPDKRTRLLRQAQMDQAQANDASTATELCAASRALLAFRNPLPALGGARGEEITRPQARFDASNWFEFLSSLYSAPSTRPYCYIAIPPAGGCSADCRPAALRTDGGGPRLNLDFRSDGDKGGGGGAVAVALPAVALLWYLMR